MARSEHYVIIGNGVAGSEAALHLRRRDQESRITMVSAGKLLSINRYELPKIFSTSGDWRDFLLHPPEYFDTHNIAVRRNTWVTHVDPASFRYTRLAFDGDVMIGALCLGRTDQVGVLRGLIQTKVHLGPWKERLMHQPNRITEAYIACAYETK